MLKILLGLLILVSVVSIPIGLGWLMYKLDTITPPQWLNKLGIILIILFVLCLAYMIGDGIL